MEKFNLQAPSDPGIYELRFRTVNQASLVDAFSAWQDDKGQEPDASTTIGVILVKE